MSAILDDGGEDRPLAQAMRIHHACERFEAQWRTGGQPRIEAFLDSCPGADRSALVHELLALELELRQERGEKPNLEEYLARFPDLDHQVRSAFLTADASSDGLPPTVAWTSGASGDQRASAAGEPESSHRDAPVPPDHEQIGDYILLEEIARGGMGIVYKARQVSLDRTVALKMILSGTLATPEERARFRREAELAGKLDHPNIVPIHEVREQDGILFFSMKLIEGGSLAHRKGMYRRNPEAAARLIATLARALDYAHGKGFFHCDLKPSNILIDLDGQPRITDFGLARKAVDENSLTVSGAILGTPSYMAPEQAAGQRKLIGAATDVYGLGAILYELLSGRPPFHSPSMMETVVQVLERDPAPPHELVADVPRALETICMKCLEKLPEDRYSSARALAEDLERFLQGDMVEATGVFQGLRRWTRREPEVVSRVGGLAIVALCTEFNYRVLTSDPSRAVHYKVQLTLAIWALSALIFQLLWRKGWSSDLVRMLWSAADLFFLTLAIWVLGKVESTLLVGYPLLIAASGLWFRIKLVWFTTILAVAGYLFLYLNTAIDWTAPFPTWSGHDLQYPNIYVAGLLLTGFVVARQLKRTLALGRYYENRQGG